MNQIQTYQELIEWAERYKVLQNKLGEVDENQTEEICCATTETLNAIISYLKGRIEEVKK